MWGFGDKELYRVLTEELKFDYVIRLRGNIKVTAGDGQARKARDWVGAKGRARLLRGARVKAEDQAVGSVVRSAKGMKEPWCLATSYVNASARNLIDLYAKRWSIECGLRDAKDLRFGMGMASMRVSTPERRDRLWLICAFAVALLTLLGQDGEAPGYDRHLRTSTAKRRVHSLFRQGCLLYDLIPTMSEMRVRPFMQHFPHSIAKQPLFAELFGTYLKMKGFMRLQIGKQTVFSLEIGRH